MLRFVQSCLNSGAVQGVFGNRWNARLQIGVRSLMIAAAVAFTQSAEHALAVILPLVINTTTSTPLLVDDFESPAAPGNPVAATGSWSLSESGGGTIDNSTAQAFEGSQSVRVVRAGGGFSRLDGNFATQTPGNVLHAQFMVYVTSPLGEFLPNILLFGPGDTSPLSMTPADAPGGGTGVDSIRLAVGNFSSFNFSTTLFSAFQTNEWQKWEMIHTVGSNTATFVIDGISDTFTNVATTSFDHLAFVGGANGSQEYFIDAAVFVEPPALPVPEPSALALATLGLVGLGLKARRGQRTTEHA